VNSNNLDIPRLTWWDHRGTREWVQYDFPQPAEVYWFDDRATGGCRVPASWRLFYRNGDHWTPVGGASVYGTDIDRYNRVTFQPIQTTSLRIEVQLQQGWSGGVLEWKVGK
jgi:hypothetical protein